MNLNHLALHSTLALALGLSYTGVASAQTAAPAKAAPKAAAAKPAAAPAANVTPPPATPEQISAAERVNYGVDDCEFNQRLEVKVSQKYKGYVEVVHGNVTYVMTPVESATGAIRLEDVRGEGLLVQIANKSMLLNPKTGKRIVDDCVDEKQLSFRAAQKAAKEANGGKDTGSGLLGKPAGK